AALPYALAVERAAAIERSDLTFALVDHLHIAAERDRGDCPFRPIRTNPARPHHAPEADREAQDLDACETGDDVVAELVERDEHAEGDGEGEDFLQEIHHREIA